MKKKCKKKRKKRKKNPPLPLHLYLSYCMLCELISHIWRIFNGHVEVCPNMHPVNMCLAQKRRGLIIVSISCLVIG